MGSAVISAALSGTGYDVRLYPTFTVQPALANLPQRPASALYPPAPLYDFARGDFVRDGAGHIVIADGYTAWAQRSIKTILTRKRSSPLYSPLFGTALDLDMRVPGRAARQQAITNDLRFALKRDPATAEVDSFVFAYSGSGERAVNLSCRLSPTVGLPVQLDVPYLFGQV